MTDGRGFTLIEMMMTVVIVGILAAIAIPGYLRTKERNYWQEAESLLLAIYAGERAYFLINDQYRAVAVDAGMTEWRKINIDDPNLPSIPVSYSVASPTATTFTATATHSCGGKGRTRTIDETRTLTAGTCWPGCGC